MSNLELNSQPITIQTIYTWFRDNKLYVNRLYQRKLVWTLEEKQKLIESILNKYPIPAILIAEREDERGEYEIIDGLQRLHAIVSFIETSYATLDDKYFDLELFPTAKRWSEAGAFTRNTLTNKLDQNEISTVLDYNLALSVMRNATKRQVNDVFDRINTYGHRLSDQERRQAGVQNDFSNTVRLIACDIRGDVSDEILALSLMPSISIDLPMTKHGYEVRAEEVFWVRHGILRSTDLRDSMDEQCIADILACIVGGQIITRSKDALDAIYHEGEDENKRILDGLNAYGATRITEEFKYCIDEIDKICNVDGFEKLKNILYKDKNSNAFPSVFAVLFISLHESFVKDNKMISDYIEARKAISGMLARIDERRRAGAPDARRRDINAVRGLLSSCLIDSDDSREIYGSNSTVDIENSIRRSEAELANYELKQGLLSLSGKERNIDLNIINKVCKTICAIANNGPKRGGKIFIGVADKQSDVDKIIELDNKITPKKIGQRSVVGVRREAIFLSITIQEYVSKWKDGISNSELSLKLKNDVLSTLDYHDFYGLGIIIITIPPQSEISYFGDDTYYRNVDSTQKAEGARLIGMIASRFLFA